MTTATIDDYQTLCEKGRLAAGTMDTGRWIVGDLACLVVSRYKEHNLDDFAREINVQKASVYQYRQVCAFYEPSTRVEFLETNSRITYTHMRIAMALKSLDRAYDFLQEASANGYTTDEAAHHIGEIVGNGGNKPVKAVLSDFHMNKGTLHAYVKIGNLEALNTFVGKTVQIVIKEVTE